MILLGWEFNMLFRYMFLFSFCAVVACNNNYNFQEEKNHVSLNFDSNCLSQIEPTFSRYKAGHSEEQEIRYVFNCLQKTIDYVRMRAKGQEESSYNAGELKNLANKFLFKGSQKDISFYQDLLVVKSQILGGDSQRITFEEFNVLKLMLEDLEKVAFSTKAQAPYLFYEKPFEDEKKIDQALKTLKEFLKRWIFYSGKDLLINPFRKFFIGKSSREGEIVTEVFNLLRAEEKNAPSILYERRDLFFTKIESYYKISLLFKKSFSKNWETDRADFYGLSRSIDRLLNEIRDSIAKKPSASWTLSDLMSFTDLMSESEVLDQKISKEVQEHILNIFFKKYFPTATEKTELNLANFDLVIESWKNIKKFLEEAKAVEGRIGETFPKAVEGDSSFALFSKQRWPSLVTKEREIFVPDYKVQVRFSFQGLLHNSWAFELARVLIKAYSKEPKEEEGVNIDELRLAYWDVLVFLKEIGFLDEKSKGSWFRIFNEGNLFVPSAKSNRLVDRLEAAEYFSYMFSAYFSGKRTFEKIKERCPYSSEYCSFNYVLERSEFLFDKMPGLGRYFHLDLSVENFRRWQESFEYIAKITLDDSPFKESHWFRGAVGSQYTEIIFRKYDLDHSDTLSFKEVSLAFPDFKEALVILAKSMSSTSLKDYLLKGYFTYFVKHSKAPESKAVLFKHAALCRSEDSQKETCVFESDRSRIMALLAYLTKVEINP